MAKRVSIATAMMVMVMEDDERGQNYLTGIDRSSEKRRSRNAWRIRRGCFAVQGCETAKMG
jgi:hypothetical protein